MGFFQPPVPPLPAALDFRGKTALVTGANSGLGFAACLHYLQHNISALIITVRRAEIGEATKRELLSDPIVRSLTKQPEILIFELDLLSHSAVTSFVAKLKADVPKLDIALLNAGMSMLHWSVSPETKNEQVFQVNYLSTAILAMLLLPLLRSTALSTNPQTPSYLSIVCSQTYPSSKYIKHPVPESASIFESFNDKEFYSPMARYPDSKLLVRLFVHELAKHTDPSTVIVNCMCPGMVETNLARDLQLWLRIAVKIVFAIRARTPEQGSRVLVHAAGIAGTKSHGEFIVNNEIMPIIPWVTSEQGQEMEAKLWKETLIATDQAAPGSLRDAALE